jgi:hypothetical protein
MSREVITSDRFALPKTNHRIHATTNYLSGRGVSTSADPLLMTIFLRIQLSDELSVLTRSAGMYRLY